MSAPVPGLVIAAPASGSGKTTVTLAVIAAARRRGLVVQPFKVGPDFIDPGHLGAVAARPARTLDGWMLGREACLASWASGTAGADVAIVEGMMGLFDGVSGASDAGSTAEIARWLELPVVLVVDAGAMARSVAAVVRGFRDFDPALRVAGVIFNRLGGPGHLAFLEAALASTDALPCLGGLPQLAALAVPERHLGLATAAETTLPEAALAAAAERHLRVDAVLALAGVDGRPPAVVPVSVARSRGVDRPSPATPGEEGRAPAPPGGSAATPAAGPGVREAAAPVPGSRARRAGGRVTIAVARDRAFSFYYPENLERLARAGAELVDFSPLADDALPPRASGVVLGGGYPELYAAGLAGNGRLLEALRRLAAAGGLVYAECGGLMLLGAGLTDGNGTRHAMAGVFPFSTRMLPQGMTLGYREVEVVAGGLLPPLVARGHEFHHSVFDATPDLPDGIERLYRVRDPVSGITTREGFTTGRVLASYVHLHFASAPALAPALVEAARAAARVLGAGAEGRSANRASPGRRGARP
jgi:cobyrinic acid a,c-diamide synthase